MQIAWRWLYLLTRSLLLSLLFYSIYDIGCSGLVIAHSLMVSAHSRLVIAHSLTVSAHSRLVSAHSLTVSAHSHYFTLKISFYMTCFSTLHLKLLLKLIIYPLIRLLFYSIYDIGCSGLVFAHSLMVIAHSLTVSAHSHYFTLIIPSYMSCFSLGRLLSAPFSTAPSKRNPCFGCLKNHDISYS